jgi:ribonuclease VapC
VIAVDTSALMAVVLDEPAAPACILALADAGRLLISAVTAAEARVVAAGRNVGAEMTDLLHRLGLQFVEADEETSIRVAAVYARWGKGVHPARLNFADCFAYDVARQHACPLLYVGNDFAQTDIAAALTA